MDTPNKNNCGFSLTELLTAVSILGILSSIALPNYFEQMQRTKQQSMAASMEQLLVRVVSSKEEIGLPPTTWEELNDQAAIITKSGPASTSNGTLDQSLDLNENSYLVQRIGNTSDSNYYIFNAINSNNIKRNVLGCIDLKTGASDVKLGSKDSTTKGAVTESDLKCK